MQEKETGEMSFWDHLDVLRGTLFRSVLALVFVCIGLFFFKSFIFDKIILAPTHSDFFLYKLLGVDFEMSLINFDLTAQFFIHLKVTALAAVILTFPYLCYEIWRFIAPGLYENEKAVVKKSFLFAGVLFYAGLAFGFYFVLPVCLNFFLGYTVSDTINNSIAISYYISLFSSTVFMIGLVFEFPAVVAVLSKFGLVTRPTMRKYRRHAIVAVLCVSAIVTPADPLSMIVVAIPLYMLYELSIILCRGEEEEEPSRTRKRAVETSEVKEVPAIDTIPDPVDDLGGYVEGELYEEESTDPPQND